MILCERGAWGRAIESIFFLVSLEEYCEPAFAGIDGWDLY